MSNIFKVSLSPHCSFIYLKNNGTSLLLLTVKVSVPISPEILASDDQ